MLLVVSGHINGGLSQAGGMSYIVPIGSIDILAASWTWPCIIGIALGVAVILYYRLIKISLLLKRLRDGPEGIRRSAAQALGKIGGRRVVVGLIKTLSDEDWKVRRASAAGLGQTRDTRAVEPLMKAVADEDRDVRRECSWALGEIGDTRAVESLIKALSDKDWQVRRNSAWGLGRLGDSKAIAALIKAIDDKNWEARLNAAHALGEFGDKSAVPALERALDDTSPYVYQAVRAALNRIEPKVLHAESDDEPPLFGDHHIYVPKTWRSEDHDTTD